VYSLSGLHRRQECQWFDALHILLAFVGTRKHRVTVLLHLIVPAVTGQQVPQPFKTCSLLSHTQPVYDLVLCFTRCSAIDMPSHSIVTSPVCVGNWRPARLLCPLFPVTRGMHAASSAPPVYYHIRSTRVEPRLFFPLLYSVSFALSFSFVSHPPYIRLASWYRFHIRFMRAPLSHAFHLLRTI